ncbi:signal recognition particle-docking protein FtsY [Desulforhopalus singaporensis]|uniref:Signal recognition particle receptor FtsY n=1 Tax=Desulforhopalus singaporensis TaxID=91360 RepID=A0A1H0P2J5_9BACT|nr:signal recognition particle-docking protein FtsY [Desulforhopalus singaporensis]SDO99232.1 fused signal recognition particle receptor [Desulforhopalus singaporensis]
MLGWFKKKFTKKEPQQEPLVAEETPLESSEDIEKIEPAEETAAGVQTTVDQAHQEVAEVEPPSVGQQQPPPDDGAAEETVETAVTEVEEEEQEQGVGLDTALPEEEVVVAQTESAETAAAEEEVGEQPDQQQDEDVTPAEPVQQQTQEAPVKPHTDPVPKPRVSPQFPAKSADAQKQEGGPGSSKQKTSLFSRLTQRLGKTRESLTYQMDALFLGKKEIDGVMLDDLEEILITADIGVNTAMELIEEARRKVKRKELSDPSALKELLKKQIRAFILENDEDAALVMPEQGPFVIMVIGVNGVGKTTTIGKIANKFIQSGSSVMLVAGDTFRAAAVSQLKIWGERNNVPVIAHKEGADPSSVVFDALGIAQSKNVDVVLVDTAGRMHTKDNLMEELKKIKRVMNKKLPGSPHEIMLVIDATTGQNGISQARLFNDAVGVTGLTLTKLDGTSKGGIVANICREMKIPIRFIGIGEQMDDLRDFDAGDFVDALFADTNQQSR